MKTTWFPGHLKAAVGYLKRHPRVRLAFGDPPRAIEPARFCTAVRAARGIHYGSLVFVFDSGHRVHVPIVGGGTHRAPADWVPRETGVRFEPGAFVVEHGVDSQDVVRVEYREGPAMICEGED